MTYKIHTFGCKVNIYESEYIINIMNKNGYKLLEKEEEPNIYIVNTCTVTNEADKKDRKMINHIRKTYPKSILIVIGCYSQIHQDIDADIILGNKYKSTIPELLEEFLKNKQQIIKVTDIKETNFEDMYIERFINHTRAFVKIQDGCNAFCSYCLIPYSRGGLRSKEQKTVIDEVTNLVENGYKEIVLTGIHTGKYGKESDTSLEKLLSKLVKIPNLLRIRLSSIEINEITPGIINLIKTSNKMAKHLHIPLQSGSDEILKSMNRHYTKTFFINKINEIRKEIPDISITTDLIIGFPGETEKLFEETKETLNKIKFTKIHTFPYSKRSGTKAAIMKNQIDGNIKKCRVKEIITLSDINEELFYKSKIGNIYDGVIETRNNNTKVVVTSNYIPVEINEINQNKDVVKVRIENVNGLKVTGSIIN